MKIEYRGFWNHTGYGLAAMTNVTALKIAKHQVNVKPYQNSSHPIPPNQFFGSPDVIIDHSQPYTWGRNKVDGTLHIGYTTWEADRIPNGWLENIHKMDQLWVPCEWNKEVFRKCGVVIPIHVIPHHVLQPRTPKKPHNGRYRFYTIATAHYRKNYPGLIEAFKKTLQKVDAELWVKIAGSESNYYKNLFQKAGLMDNVVWIDERYSTAQMSDLHASCDCYVSLNTGEGFGLPIADAIAHGNRVVVTGYGAVLDYAKGHADFVPYKLGPVHSSMRSHGFDGSMSDAKADVEEAAKIMSDIAMRKRKIVFNLSEKVLKDHSYETLALKMEKAMNDRDLTFNFLDNGIGDMICFLYAFEGFRKYHSALRVHLKWHKNKFDWHHCLQQIIKPIDNGFVGQVIDIGLAHNQNAHHKRSVSTKSYKQQYADLIFSTPMKPCSARKGNGNVLIFPSAAWENRQWSKEGFKFVADGLKAKGYSILFVDYNDKQIPDGYQLTKLTPDQIISEMKKASLVIGNESGMAHLAGMLDTPCICISGDQPKSKVHDMNQVEVLHSRGLNNISKEAVLTRALSIVRGV